MKRLWVILFLILFTLNAHATNISYYEEDIYDELAKHTVSILSVGLGFGLCSGVLLAEDDRYSYVLTAKHCLHVIEEMHVNHNKVKLVVGSTKDDLAILVVIGKIANKKPVKLAKYRELIDSKVYHLAYPNFKFEEYATSGTILRYTDDWGWTKDLIAKGGCSGGGIFNEDRELIGILWGRLEDITVFEPITDIKDFLLDVEHIIKKKW